MEKVVYRTYLAEVNSGGTYKQITVSSDKDHRNVEKRAKKYEQLAKRKAELRTPKENLVVSGGTFVNGLLATAGGLAILGIGLAVPVPTCIVGGAMATGVLATTTLVGGPLRYVYTEAKRAILAVKLRIAENKLENAVGRKLFEKKTGKKIYAREDNREAATSVSSAQKQPSVQEKQPLSPQTIYRRKVEFRR